MNRCEQAVGYHKKGFNCCQSVLAAYQDLIGLTEAQCLTLGGGFGAPAVPLLDQLKQARAMGYTGSLQSRMGSWFDDDWFDRPFRMLEPFFGGFGDRMLTEFPRPVNVLEQAQTADPEDTGRDDLLPHDEAMSLALERKRNALETQLRNAVAEERFEDAAHLRDELKALGEKAS